MFKAKNKKIIYVVPDKNNKKCLTKKAKKKKN